MDDIVVIKLWAQLAFKQNLSDAENILLNKCAMRILELLGHKHET